LIAEQWLGERSELFNVAIQSGAILAIVLILLAPPAESPDALRGARPPRLPGEAHRGVPDHGGGGFSRDPPRMEAAGVRGTRGAGDPHRRDPDPRHRALRRGQTRERHGDLERRVLGRTVPDPGAGLSR